ncbi:glycoside hydrolase [Aspergillus egyptiacus]|nr:glycoside hydrolase [Aspergillus egyptiacus]
MHLKTLLLALAATTLALPQRNQPTMQTNTTDRLVFCHFMIGITSNRKSPSDYDADMQAAKDLGIDAFALNIGTDPYTDTQLSYAYESAVNNNMSVFLSFDFNWYKLDQAAAVGQKIAQYASHPAQLTVDGGKVFVSSFAGDGIDVTQIKSAAGAESEIEIFWAPNYHPGMGDFGDVDGALNWMGWDHDGNNKAPKGGNGNNITVAEGDQEYLDALQGKPYLAPASGWFFTHFGGEVPYSKNWVFPGDLLWYNRWHEILQLGPRFVEIVTWNDYGESHYIGPLSSPHTDDGASKWVMDMPHTGWLEMSRPFIAAYKAGDSSPDAHITTEKLIYWYRPTPRDINCDETDTTTTDGNGSPDNSTGNFFRGRPDGWETLRDEVFVVSLLNAAGTVEVVSGGNERKFEAPAGASAFAVEMGVGKQRFALVRDGEMVMGETSLKDVVEECVCGIYNFNAYVGVVPSGEEEVDALDEDGLAMLTQGLKVPCPTNTLGSGTANATGD